MSIDALYSEIEQTQAVWKELYGLRPNNEDDISWLAISGRSTEISAQLVVFKNHAQSSLNFLRQNWRDNLSIRDANNNLSWQLFDESANIANQDASANFAQR